MAATAAVSRPPPAHPGTNGGNLHFGPNGSVSSSGQQDQGLHGTSQELGPSPQHHVSARPIFYIPAPPPPPFLPYQWPMPFSYNPFAGFPGMGYGMVMPPFPPPPYMESPAYVLPHPHIQPVDYRRLMHPPVHAPSAPYQNPNQSRRIRPQTVPVRETVSSAVQTEPTQRGEGGYSDGYPLVRSDSGHETASNSPSASSSSSQKRGSSEVENFTLPSSNAKDLQVKRTRTNNTMEQGFTLLDPTETVQSCIRATAEIQKCHTDSVDKENVPPCTTSHCNMWSVGSQDGMVPVCSSSQQEDEVVKERRVSVPDILMSWGGDTPQAMMLKMAEKELSVKDQQLPSYETEDNEKSVCQSETQPKYVPVVADANLDVENILNSEESEPVGLVGSVRQSLPYKDKQLHPQNKSQKLPDDEQENGNETKPHEDTTDVIPYQMYLNSCHMTRKMNESVWSVESLAPFIPTKDWLLQKSVFEPEIIIEMIEEAENDRLSVQYDNPITKPSKERRRSRRFSSSDSVLMSDSWLIFSTPAEKPSLSKNPEMGTEIDASEMMGPKQGQSVTPPEKDPSESLTHLQSRIILSTPTEEDVSEYRSSEPEANQSPNQESLIVKEQQEKSSCSPEQEETLLLNSAVGENILSAGQLFIQNGVNLEVEHSASKKEEVSQPGNDQLCVPTADQMTPEVSPSKGHLVDCGIQCTEFQERSCDCEELKSRMGLNRRHPYKYSDMKKGNGGKAEGVYTYGHTQKNHQKKHGPLRNRGQEKQSNQQEVFNGYYGKPGKSKGGSGRNQRY